MRPRERVVNLQRGRDCGRRTGAVVPVNVVVFANRVFVDVIKLKKRQNSIRMDSKFSDGCLYWKKEATQPGDKQRNNRDRWATSTNMGY